jgi:uncharacterized repeat protein (TIGR04138 family)
MPPRNDSQPTKTLEQVVQELDRYPVDAFQFVQEGLNYTVQKLQRPQKGKEPQHVTGEQLCEGLREYALHRWGRLARTVLRRWGINSTYDFGQIVFALIANKIFAKTDEDDIEDFRDVYDFRSAFESDYRIPETQPQASAKGRQ